MKQRVFATSEVVDFVIVGAGSAGGVMARELSMRGFSVVVLEQGPWRRTEDFSHHDELGTWFLGGMVPSMADFPQTFRARPDETAAVRSDVSPLLYAQGVGGSSVHFSGNFWRLRPVDFRERSMLGPIAGTAFADWPITYEELEPYYTKVDWEIGVSGAPGPKDPPRSRPYPLPPMPVKSSGAILEEGARKLGLTAQPAPVAILSQPYDGRSACVHCGYCVGYGCEMAAKSSTLVTMIPKAVASGNCEIRPDCTVLRVEVDRSGRASGVLYVDGAGAEHVQSARAVILAANGAETPRLLLLSASAAHPDGLANSSGIVGKHLMFNGHADVFGSFEHPLNEHKSIQATRIIHDFYESDPRRGFYGGGGMDGRLFSGPLMFAAFDMPPDGPQWGTGFTKAVHDLYTHTMQIACATTSLPLESNSVSLDPELRDRYGRAALRTTYHDHADDISMASFLQDRARELLGAGGAERIWAHPAGPATIGVHLLGTCRMGNDPKSSVVDRYHRAHDVRNLFICDGSSMVSSGRGQPTMTIMALAFRAAEAIAGFAQRNEI
jgi:choline dehydrogenase-like flavoprotein